MQYGVEAMFFFLLWADGGEERKDWKESDGNYYFRQSPGTNNPHARLSLLISHHQTLALSL